MSPPPLRPYQHAMVDHVHRNPRAALYLDMGLGKTCICLTALTPDHLPALVTAPKRVAENVWEEEVAKWRPDLRIAVANSSIMDAAARDALLRTSKADIIVIGRDNLAQAVPYAGRFKTFIIDESSGFKSHTSARFKTAKKIALPLYLIPNVWELTGTPSPNGYLDLWAPTYLLDEGKRLGHNITTYRGRYFYPGRQLRTGVITEWILKPGADRKIFEKIEDICVSMEAEGRVEVQKPLLNFVDVPLLPAVRQAYKKFKRDLVVDMEMLGGVVHSADGAAAVSNRLSQLTQGFMFVDDADLHDRQHHIYHQEKIKALKEIVEGTGSPVLVGYRFNPEKAMILKSLREYGIRTIDEPGVVKDWNAGKVRVLLAHPASAGHGLNLQHGGNVQVWTSPTWSLEEWLQFNARLARSGQEKQVIIHVLRSPFTVDEAMLDTLTGKKSMQDALRDHLESPL